MRRSIVIGVIVGALVTAPTFLGVKLPTAQAQIPVQSMPIVDQFSLDNGPDYERVIDEKGICFVFRVGVSCIPK